MDGGDVLERHRVEDYQVAGAGGPIERVSHQHAVGLISGPVVGDEAELARLSAGAEAPYEGRTGREVVTQHRVAGKPPWKPTE